MVRPSASYVMSRVVAMGAPYRLPVARHTGGNAREPWSAAAIGIGRRAGRADSVRGAGGVQLGGVTDAPSAPPDVDPRGGGRRSADHGPGAGLRAADPRGSHRDPVLGRPGDR